MADCGGAAVCDPLACGGRIFVLALGPTGGEFAAPLCLVELQPESGEAISRRQIVEATQREKWLPECQVSWAANRLIVLLAGNIFATDMQGRIAWLREEMPLPWPADPNFSQQQNQPAIETEGRIFVQQPGSCAIDCLDLETGELRWRCGITGLQAIYDLAGDRLLAKSARGLAVLNKTSGKLLWQHEYPEMQPALARTTSGMILATRHGSVGDKAFLEFLWIDAATGRTRAHSQIPLEQNQPMVFGPMAAGGGHIWCCFGYSAKGESTSVKRILELRAVKPAVEEEP